MYNGLETIKLSELPEAITLNESDYSFIVQNGTSKKIKGLLLKGNAGDNGKSIEIQKTDTHIQWRQEGGQWINLVALADLKVDEYIGQKIIQGSFKYDVKQDIIHPLYELKRDFVAEAFSGSVEDFAQSHGLSVQST